MKAIKMEYANIIDSHFLKKASDNDEEIRNLLLEFVRRLLLIKKVLTQKGLIPKNNLIFDATSLLQGVGFKTNSLIKSYKPDQVDFNFTDKFVLGSYFNFKYNLLKEVKLNHDLHHNPYEPYIEIIKMGGKFLNYQYNRIEVFPYISILLYPLEEFALDTPYWTNKC